MGTPQYGVHRDAANSRVALNYAGTRRFHVNGSGAAVVGTFSSSGALTVTSGGLTVTAGDLTVTAGDLTVTAGDLAVSAGSLTVTGADGAGACDAGDSQTLIAGTGGACGAGGDIVIRVGAGGACGGRTGALRYLNEAGSGHGVPDFDCCGDATFPVGTIGRMSSTACAGAAGEVLVVKTS